MALVSTPHISFRLFCRKGYRESRLLGAASILRDAHKGEYML